MTGFRYKMMGQDELHARAGHIEFDGKYHHTPFNVPTSSEENTLAAVRKAITGLGNLKFPQPVMEINKFVNKNKINNWTGTPSSALVNQIEDYADKALSTSFRLVHSRNTKIPDPVSRFATALQIQSGIDWLGIHDISFNAKPEDFDKRLSTEINFIEENHEKHKYVGMKAIIRLDAPAEYTRRKIRIAEDNGIRAIDFVYASLNNIRPSLQVVRELSQDKGDIWFHLAGVSKKSLNASIMHIIQPFGFDTYSLYTPRGGGKSENPRPLNFEWFEKSRWGFLNQDVMKLNCPHPTCKGHTTKSFIDVYNGSSTSSGALKFHNSLDSLHEFSKSREKIMAGGKELRNYIATKPDAAYAIKKLFGIDVNPHQKRLSFP